VQGINIYVGNVPFSTTDDDLRDLFEQYGRVDTAKILVDRATGRSRGFWFRGDERQRRRAPSHRAARFEGLYGTKPPSQRGEASEGSVLSTGFRKYGRVLRSRTGILPVQRQRASCLPKDDRLEACPTGAWIPASTGVTVWVSGTVFRKRCTTSLCENGSASGLQSGWRVHLCLPLPKSGDSGATGHRSPLGCEMLARFLCPSNDHGLFQCENFLR
jgi:hypothetical protein